MPCYDPRPLPYQVKGREACQHIAWIHECYGTPIPGWVERGIDWQIDSEEISHQIVAYLCEMCHAIEKIPTIAEKIIYNGRERKARNLANWWEDHQEMDNERSETDQPE